jgi:hypothetical protein
MPVPIPEARLCQQEMSESDLTDLDSSDSGSLAEFDTEKTRSVPTTSTTSICDEDVASAISEPLDVAPSPISLSSEPHNLSSDSTRKKRRRINPTSSPEDPNDVNNIWSTSVSKSASQSSVIDLTSPTSTQEPSTSQITHSDYSIDALVWIRVNYSEPSAPTASDACPTYLWWPGKVSMTP